MEHWRLEEGARGGRGEQEEEARGKGSERVFGVWCGKRKLGESSVKKASVGSIKNFRVEDYDVIHWYKINVGICRSFFVFRFVFLAT